MTKVYTPFSYGNQTLVRQELVDDIIKQRELVNKVALTNQHPAFRELVEMEHQATDAEMELVNKVSSPFVCTI